MPAEVGNLAYMERLGLWGPGAAFPTFQAFLDSMKRRGITFLEMVGRQGQGAGQGTLAHAAAAALLLLLCCRMSPKGASPLAPCSPLVCASPAPSESSLQLSMELKGDGLYVSRGLSFRCVVHVWRAP
jgi:hypothetical protein